MARREICEITGLKSRRRANSSRQKGHFASYPLAPDAAWFMTQPPISGHRPDANSGLQTAVSRLQKWISEWFRPPFVDNLKAFKSPSVGGGESVAAVYDSRIALFPWVRDKSRAQDHGALVGGNAG